MPEQKMLIAHPPAGTTLYAEKRFTIRRCDLALPNGSNESRALMVHPGAVVLVPILADGRIVMIRNRRWQIGHCLLELPAGTREAHESFEACARRELEEETGYRTDNLKSLPPFFAAPGVSTEVMHPYVARDLIHVGQSLAPDEKIEVVVMTQNDLRVSIQSGEVIDGKTLSVLGRLFLGGSL